MQRARDAFLPRGLSPSIEAVRAELGHTGSKTTILRYLRELDVAEPHPPPDEFVGRIAGAAAEFS
ncbi:DNA-binding protein [Pseudomonas shirazensis]|uniref:DNA-binding protein n=1 Tax=Pseudomonas shirazensis TaxID=2745494 RepID=UPI0039889EC6